MKRWFCVLASLMATMVATPALAQAGDNRLSSQVVSQLRDQGYDEIEASRTWLGRLRFTAERGDMHREIVINPKTGEILRDLRSNFSQLASDDHDDETGGEETHRLRDGSDVEAVGQEDETGAIGMTRDLEASIEDGIDLTEPK